MLGKRTEQLGSVGMTLPATFQSQWAGGEVFLGSQYRFCLFIFELYYSLNKENFHIV